MRAVPLDGAVHFHQTEPVSIVTPPCIGSPVSRVAATLVPVAEVEQPLSGVAAENASFDGAASASCVSPSASTTAPNTASAATLPPTPNTRMSPPETAACFPAAPTRHRLQTILGAGGDRPLSMFVVRPHRSANAATSQSPPITGVCRDCGTNVTG